MKVCVYTKTLNREQDEAIAKLAYEISTRVLMKDNEVLTLYSHGNLQPNEKFIRIPGNTLFLYSTGLDQIIKFKPDILLFIPRASASLLVFIYARLMKWKLKAHRLVVYALQPNIFNFVSKKIAYIFKPDLVLTASTKDRNQLIDLGCRAKFISIGVDCRKFVPSNIEIKTKLRYKYGLAPNSFIILHVGHLTLLRNIGVLKSMQQGDQQVIVVASTSTPHDATLHKNLTDIGIKVFTQYFEDIQEIYQLSDCYVFPTTNELSCVSIPVSVQEAMACNLPVISTSFGGLKDLYPTEENGLFYADNEVEMIEKIAYLRGRLGISDINTRNMMQNYCYERWDSDFTRSLTD